MAEVIAIVTYGGTALGTHDSYITTDVGQWSTTYTVHCDYINTDDLTPFHIVSASQRAAAEVYLADLASVMNLTQLASLTIGQREVHVAPSNITPQTLLNNWTGLSIDGCYCTSISHNDVGGRYYGFSVTFTKPHTDSSGDGGAAFSYKGFDLGNIPMGYIETDVDGSFNSYTVVCGYRGEDSGTYIADLADSIGIGHIHKHDIQRGAQGNRGVVKSYDVVSGDLNSIEPNTNMPSITGVYPVSIDSSEEATGVLKLTFNFTKSR